MASEKTPRKIDLVFFRNDAGGEPAREWLKGLDEAERRAIGTDLLRAQWRWPVGMPLCRPMGKGLWEVRTNLPSGRTAETMSKKNLGSTIDDFLTEENIFAEPQPQ